jgi:hypothetical protein
MMASEPTRLARMQDGTTKQFIDLKKDEVFAVVPANDKDDVDANQWWLATSDGYQLFATQAVDCEEWPRKIKRREATLGDSSCQNI